VDEQDSVDLHLEGFLREYPEIDAEVEGIVDRVCKLHKYFVNLMEDTVAGHGLAHGEYKLLLRLRAWGSEQGRSAGDLSKALIMSSGGMTNLLDRLEKDGLVRRGTDPADRRGVLVTLTPKGRKAIDRAVSEEAAVEAQYFDALTPGQRKELNDLLRRVVRGFEKGRAAPPRRPHDGATASSKA